MRNLLLISLVMVLSSGCAAVRKFQTWERVQDERYSYYDVQQTIEEAVPESLRQKCGYKLLQERPKTTAVTFQEMQAKRNAEDDLVSGSYNPLTKETLYIKGDPDALLHEYQHFFDLTMVVTAADRPKCDFEIKAYLSEYASKQRRAKEAWQKEARRLKRELETRRR